MIFSYPCYENIQSLNYIILKYFHLTNSDVVGTQFVIKYKSKEYLHN